MLSKEINWVEFLISTAISFAIAGIVHLIVVNINVHDIETWSGTAETARYIPEWVEEYEEAITTTDSDGNVSVHYETCYTTHSPEWEVLGNYGNNIKQWHGITKDTYDFLYCQFGGIKSVAGERDGYHSGDQNDYWLVNNKKYFQPLNIQKTFKNKVRNSPSLFSFIRVPTNISVFEYPANKNIFTSDRLLGTAKNKINLLTFDRMNSRLGPVKRVNVIIVGFPKGCDSIYGQYQQAKWINGKKNDLVITYSESDRVDWCFVFGWTEKEIVKHNIALYLIGKKINNSVLSTIEKIIQEDYAIKDWSKFDYIKVQPKPKHFLIYSIILLIVQIVYWIICFRNDHRGIGLF